MTSPYLLLSSSTLIFTRTRTNLEVNQERRAKERERERERERALAIRKSPVHSSRSLHLRRLLLLLLLQTVALSDRSESTSICASFELLYYAIVVANARLPQSALFHVVTFNHVGILSSQLK